MEKQEDIEIKKEFQSPSEGNMALSEVMENIREYMEKDSSYNYRLIIGTDSKTYGDRGISFITAIVIQRVGNGAKYYWQRNFVEHEMELRPRIYQEAQLSIETSNMIEENWTKLEEKANSFEIHIDVGQNGSTRTMIEEIVSLVEGNGYDAKIKPEAYGASSVADKYA